jgi:nuclear pore complex protein Nup205
MSTDSCWTWSLQFRNFEHCSTNQRKVTQAVNHLVLVQSLHQANLAAKDFKLICTTTIGKITIDGDEYSVNDEFQQVALQIADTLDLDELETAKLTFEAQKDSILPPSPIPTVIVAFHERRELLLQSLRIILHEAVNGNDEDGMQHQFQSTVSDILEVRTGPVSNGSAYTRKCLSALQDIEKWQNKIAEHAQAASVVGQSYNHDVVALLDIQRLSLLKQHEALGAIVALLFKGSYTISEDLRKLLQVPHRWDKLDFSLIHYLPAFSAAFAQYGSPEHSSSLQEARSLHTAVVTGVAQGSPSVMQPFFAVLNLWWIAEYSGWYRDPTSLAPIPGADLIKEAAERTISVNTALHNSALEFQLSLCISMTVDEWHHPARQELVTLLLSESSGLSMEAEPISDYFHMLFMESLETFAESWITNMPDTIRKLKIEEDEKRLQEITAMQDGLSSAVPQDRDNPLHLECFLVIISFAFEHRLEAAEEFWADPDSNLFGFLQWASRRQTVPRVSAFCEMLCAIAEGPDCAESAHKFLLDESATASRTRRTPSMNYVQMFNELELYATKVHEKPGSSQIPQVRKVLPTDMNELESPVMLSCYLRLIAHMCKESESARRFVFENTSVNFVQVLLVLSAGPVPSYLRASIFTTLEALMTQKVLENSHHMWSILDQWASGGPGSFMPALANASPTTHPPHQTLQRTLSALSLSFDQYNSIVLLLKTLVAPPTDAPRPSTALAFPTDLGSSYRTPGIEPYTDFVCGQLFAKLSELPDEAQVRIFQFHCLDFIATCLETFNENFVALVDRNVQPGALSESASLAAPAVAPPVVLPSMIYAERHPFARTMEWLFTSEVSTVLMSATHQSVDEILLAAPGSILVTGLLRSLDILNMIFDLQPTYLDIVRPLLKNSDRTLPAGVSTIVSFEDSIVAHPEIVADLRLYAGTSHDQLVLRSLALLQKLSSSRKLNNVAYTIGSSRFNSRRIVDMLGPNTNSDEISLSLASKMRVDIRELESGPECPGYVIKDGILAFLNSCLIAQADLPNMAHLFLGFAKVGEALIITQDSPIENGFSLLNAIIDLVRDYPDCENDVFVSWLIHIKTAALQVLRQLWASPVSSALTLLELRKYQFLFSQFSRQELVSTETLWDGCPISDLSFWAGESADALAEFLSGRAFFLEYAATELRSVAHSRLSSVQNQILALFLGKGQDTKAGQHSDRTVFDFFDFAALDIGGKFSMPELRYFASLDLEMCTSQASDESIIFYDLDAVRELLNIRITELTKDDQVRQPNEDEQMHIEADIIMSYLKATNRWSLIQTARRQALHMWVELVIATLEYCHMDHVAKTQFCLHVLQLILPKLDTVILDEAEDATELARLADTLVSALTAPSISQAHTQGRTGGMLTDRLFPLFKTCISGILRCNSFPGIREIYYVICSRYLAHTAGNLVPNRKASGAAMDGTEFAGPNRKAQRNAFDCVRSAGHALVNTLSDDAEDGVDTSRLSALALMGHLTSLAQVEKSPFIIDTLMKANMLEVMIEPLKHIAKDFQQTEPQGG